MMDKFGGKKIRRWAGSWEGARPVSQWLLARKLGQRPNSADEEGTRPLSDHTSLTVPPSKAGSKLDQWPRLAKPPGSCPLPPLHQLLLWLSGRGTSFPQTLSSAISSLLPGPQRKHFSKARSRSQQDRGFPSSLSQQPHHPSSSSFP